MNILCQTCKKNLATCFRWPEGPEWPCCDACNAVYVEIRIRAKKERLAAEAKRAKKRISTEAFLRKQWQK